MPRNKDLKRLVRARMKKTGEAYTAARAHIIRKPRTRPSTRLVAAMSSASKQDYAALAGMSDASIKAKTGCTWERCDGSYEATKSRTFDVPVTTLYDAWADKSVRDRWLESPDAKVRTATVPKSIRLGLADGSILAVGFLPKGRAKSSVAVSQLKLPDKETATRLKQYWSERLDALGDVLSER